MIKIGKFCQNCGAPLTPDGKFCESCGTPIEQPQAPPAYTQPQQPVYAQPPPVYAQPQRNVNINNPNLAVSPKSQGILIILWFFGGYFGLHHFYAGNIGMGLLYFCTVGLFGFGWIIDFCSIIGGTFRDGLGRPISN